MTSQKIILVCIVLLLMINILFNYSGLENRLKSCQNPRESLPCQAVPIRFVIDEPECADKLLRSMNVTNVHVLPAEDLHSLLNSANFTNRTIKVSTNIYKTK